MSNPRIRGMGDLSKPSQSAGQSSGFHSVGRAHKEAMEDIVDPPWSSQLNFKPNYRKLAIYLVLQLVFVYLEFGVVFFCVSVIYFVISSLRNHGNKNSDGEQQKSAYSVFNKGFEKIQGTFDADKMDKEIRRGFM